MFWANVTPKKSDYQHINLKCYCNMLFLGKNKKINEKNILLPNCNMLHLFFRLKR